jgi:outer membrane protein OmpA-like peptidoglycan-associated protein
MAVQRPTARTAPVLQRTCACGGSGGASGECEGCKKKKLQRRAVGNGPGTAPPIVHEVLGSPGQPLDVQTRAFFEPRFHYDFSRVRVHADSRAAESARAVNALAYTAGPKIVFGAGHYDPGSAQGQRLLAHELTHVVQQRGESHSQGSLRVGSVGDSHEREAERTASAAISERDLNSVGHAPGLVQRQSADPTSVPSGAGKDTKGAAGAPSTTPKPEPCAAPRDLPCSPTKGAVAGVVKTVNFVVDRSDLSDAERAKIHATAKTWHAGGASGNIRVDGYASAEYECEYNWRLSCRRAQSVAAELERPSSIAGESAPPAAVPATNISLFAHGESDEAGAALAPNRRATISLPTAPTPKPVAPPPTPTPPTRKCGPDITSALSATLTNVESYFLGGLGRWERRVSCMALTGDAPLAGVDPRWGWDVEELQLQGTGWLDSYFRSGGCGSPRDPGCDSDPSRDLCETEGTCGNTVLVGGRCMLAGTANYAIYGKMFSLCADEFWYYFGFQMRNLIRLWKTIDWDDSGPPLAMANAAFDGTFPTIPAAAENRGSCTDRCAASHSGTFHFVWEPYKSRVGGGR